MDGVSKSILTSLRKQGDTNVLDRHRPQCYTAFLVIYEKVNPDKRMLRQHRIHRDNANECGWSK